jgi:excisionase family DNA binding protein
MGASGYARERKAGRLQAEIVRVWLTYREAEQLVGLSRTTLWKLIGSGEIEHRKVGRAVRINRGSLEAYMSGEAEGGASGLGARKE